MVIQSQPSTGREPVVLRDLADVLRRRSGWLLLFTAAGIGAGAAVYASQPQSYRAEAVMALDVRRIQGMPIDQVVTPLPQESPVLRTELDMIGSRVMAQRVFAKLAEADIDPFASEGGEKPSGGVAYGGGQPAQVASGQSGSARRSCCRAAARPGWRGPVGRGRGHARGSPSGWPEGRQ